MLNIKALRATLKIEKPCDGGPRYWIGLFPGGFRSLGLVQDTPVADMLLIYLLMLGDECKRSMMDAARRELSDSGNYIVPRTYEC